MNASAKTGIWCAVGLLGSLVIAWYFSRRQTTARGDASAAAANSGDTSGDNMFTFNIPPLQMPQLGIIIPPTPTTPGTSSSASGGGCCIPCTSSVSSSTDALAQAIANSGQYNNIVQNTVTSAPKITTASHPYEPLVLTDPNNPDLAMKNPALYATDPIYAQSWDTNYKRIYQQKATSYDCANCVAGSIDGGGGYSGSANAGTFMPNDKTCIPACLPTTADMLQAIQQDLFLFGDDPNAAAAMPNTIH